MAIACSGMGDQTAGLADRGAVEGGFGWEKLPGRIYVTQEAAQSDRTCSALGFVALMALGLLAFVACLVGAIVLAQAVGHGVHAGWNTHAALRDLRARLG